MRTLVVILALFVTIIGAGCFVVLELYVKSKYDLARQSNDIAYAVIPMDSQGTAFLAKVQSDWKYVSDVTNGAEADTVRLAGKIPSVSNYIGVMNYRMPPYNWFSSSENQEAAKMKLIKAQFMPVSLDKEWHVSADEHLAFLICRSNAVYVLQDEPSGLRATIYYVKRGHPVVPPVTALDQ